MIVRGYAAPLQRSTFGPNRNTLFGLLPPKGGVDILQDGGGLPTWFAIVSLCFVTAFFFSSLLRCEIEGHLA